MTKKCTRCLVIREVTEFHKYKLGILGVKSHCKECTKDYLSKNKRHVPYNSEYAKNYRKNMSVEQKIAARLRTRLNLAIRKNQKVGSAIDDLGCTVDELKTYLESKFQPGMTWDNYGPEGWHIDHIFPLSKVNLSNRDELLKACHFTNLQPLWAGQNRSKSDKLVG